MKPEIQHIEIALADGSLAVMQFFTRLPEHTLPPLGAVDHNFTQGEDGGPWVREPSPENIAAELAASGLAVASWRSMSDDDVVAYRARRAAARDRAAPPRDFAAEIDALKAMVKR